FAIAEALLGLPFELRLGDLDAENGGQAFAYVLAGEVGVRLLDQIVLASVVIDDTRQRVSEAGQVRAAGVRVDVVDKRVDRFRIDIGPLQRALDDHPFALLLEIDWRLEYGRARVVEIFDVTGDATFVVVGIALALTPLVGEHDPQSLVQKGHFPDARGENIPLDDDPNALAFFIDVVEDQVIGPEGDAGSAPVGCANHLET